MFEATGSYDLPWWTAAGPGPAAPALHRAIDGRPASLPGLRRAAVEPA
jgi:hypothetical protein